MDGPSCKKKDEVIDKFTDNKGKSLEVLKIHLRKSYKKSNKELEEKKTYRLQRSVCWVLQNSLNYIFSILLPFVSFYTYM